MGKNTAMIIGPALGGFVLKVLGGHGVMWINALFCAVSALCVHSVRLRGDVPLAKAERPGLRGIWEGLAFYRRTPVAIHLLLTTIAINLCAVPAELGFQVHVLNVLKKDTDVLGLAFSVSAVTSVLCSLAVAASKTAKLRRMLLIGIACMGASLALTGMPTAMWMVFGSFALFGAAGPLILIPISSIYQKATPAQIRGRLFAFRSAAATLMLPVSTPVVGW